MPALYEIDLAKIVAYGSLAEMPMGRLLQYRNDEDIVVCMHISYRDTDAARDVPAILVLDGALKGTIYRASDLAKANAYYDITGLVSCVAIGICINDTASSNRSLFKHIYKVKDKKQAFLMYASAQQDDSNQIQHFWVCIYSEDSSMLAGGCYIVERGGLILVAKEIDIRPL